MTSCIQKADQILEHSAFLPGPGIYTIEIQEIPLFSSGARLKIQRFMRTILASSPNCIEAIDSSQAPDYLIRIHSQPSIAFPQNKNTKALETAFLNKPQYSLTIQIIRCCDHALLYIGEIEQKGSHHSFLKALPDMLSALIKKRSLNKGNQMSLYSSSDQSNR